MIKLKKLPKRNIYDKNYYKAQAMLRDPWFIEKAEWLKKRFTEIGCSLPKKPFKKYKTYQAWNKRYWDRYTEMEKSHEFLEAKRRITGNKRMISMEEFNALENFREGFLPPTYGRVFTEILEHFGIGSKDERFRNFLEFYFFLGQKEYVKPKLSIKFTRDSKTNETEMFLRIYGYTKKEDIMRQWDWISWNQKSLKDFVGKNKAWKTFNRDIAIYNLYKKMKDPKTKRQPNDNGLDTKLWLALKEKWPKLTISSVRTIVNRTRKRLGEI